MDLPSLDNSPIVIRESRWKAAGLGLLSVFLVWGSFLAIRGAPSHVAGYVGIVLFGAGGLISGWQLVRPSTLTLDARGFTVDQLWRSWRVRWEQSSNFHIQHGGRGFTRYVAFDYVPDKLAWGGLNRWGQLPPYWTLSPPDLCLLMKRCKDRWGDGQTPAPSRPTASEAPQPREPTVT